jgi:hypothetical protein
MVLFCLVGELGAGKTLGLTFLAWKNWFYRRKPLFSNYHLFQMPYYFIDTQAKMDMMREGFFAADELWLWIGTEKTVVTKLSTNILLKSRKRNLTYAFTSQILDQLNKRVRKILDFTAYPQLNAREDIMKCAIFRTGNPVPATYMKTIYFKTALFFTLYDTNEEVQPLQEQSDIPFKPFFQESKDSELLEFETWEEADKFAEQFWNKKYRSLKNLI